MKLILNGVNHPRENRYYFIGSTSGEGRFANAHLINEFAGYCRDMGIQFVYVNPWTNPVTDEQNRMLVQKVLCHLTSEMTHIRSGDILPVV